MHKIEVKLKQNSYPIYTDFQFRQLGLVMNSVFKRFKKPGQALFITHEHLWNMYGKQAAQSLKALKIKTHRTFLPPGEKTKSLANVEWLYHQCVKLKLDRTACIIGLGGGVIGDIAGFVAATYLRGVPLVHLPTTLLAMVDSSIGGKTGVDLPTAKNFVGAFYQPKFVGLDIRALASLPKTEFINGMAEVVKYGVIGDAQLFNTLVKNVRCLVENKNGILNQVIARCAEIKAEVVSKDEKETRSLREILNFGHTWGHAIETATGYEDYKHGEAVSLGMCAAGHMSVLDNIWPESNNMRMRELLTQAGLPTQLKKKLNPNLLLPILYHDKKTERGTLRFVLPKAIGKVLVRPVSKALALEGLKVINHGPFSDH